jgi:tRNA (guanine-N7-)-methyltransferase
MVFSHQLDKPLRSFGRRNGRLRSNPQRLLDEVLPSVRLQTAPLALPEGYTKYALEIGFGAGEHIAAQAMHHPETLYIGCEPYMPGVAKLLRVIEQNNIGNIRLYTDDARDLMATLPDGSMHEVYILFPDPWPKARHHKRRLITHDFLHMLSRLQQPGDTMLIATDHVDYAGWILHEIARTPEYQWTAERQSDWRDFPKSWAETKYQRKTSAEGRAPMFFHLQKENA